MEIRISCTEICHLFEMVNVFGRSNIFFTCLQGRLHGPRERPSSKSVEDHESLETRALVRLLAQAIEHEVHDLLADGVVTPGVVVGGILLAADHLLGVEELAVGPTLDLI